MYLHFLKEKGNFTAKSICFADIQFKTRYSITTGVKEIGQRTKKKMTKGTKKKIDSAD